VSPSSGPLVIINQIKPVLVRFPVADQDFPAVARAVSVHPLPVIASSNDSTQASEHGTLSFLDNAIDSLTGTVTGKASFPNTASRLWPGELVFLTVQLEVQRGVLAVPNEAILSGQQGSYVFVVDARNSAQMRTVATGLTVGAMTVVAQGLTDGERVVIDGQSRLNPGARVAILGGSDTAATARLSSSEGGTGAQTGVAGGEVTGVARGGAAAPRAGGAAGTVAGGVTGSGVATGASGRGAGGAVAPAPSITGVTGSANASATNGTQATTSATTSGGRPGTPSGTNAAAPTSATTGNVTTGSGGVTRSTTTTTMSPTTARPAATTTGTRTVTPSTTTPTTTPNPQRP
jgi:hypothetical protein